MTNKKSIIIYGLAMAAGAFALQWLEVQYALRLLSTEIYIVVLAIAFAGLGIWLGWRMNSRPAQKAFERNERVIKTLQLTAREVQVLERLVEGESNQEIADRMHISTSTVKTHLIHLYQKLEVARRTQAVQKARNLRIIR